ncbi:D-alanyl-D-alanine carboxypeptidase family protein [Bacillus sp. FJAT-50079]|uniref:D-alanyl-D-alanine carboxypeptidase family protein n=1 Tax=Bacillus sp. FJAT-50079 TaxID=2833577 RepID=UPI001BCA1D68|nr:D-alanyl-D-alanine carboxypeptidase family protein [Bacillus sp. FJAT-50079]MBS4209708.1 D-alanyl-D-alanine carboxypeptidase [Bacillus sp. FJAT-50079]
MKGTRKYICIGLISIVLLTLSPNFAAAISVNADGAILMEQQSGRVLYEKNPHEIRRIASITKIMTAIIAIESGKLNDSVKVSEKAVYTEGSSVYLQKGELIKLEDLVYGLMLRSGNDAATAIAEHVGGSVEGFVFLMNQKAEEIGMRNTVFANPHGLDDHEDHYSTPYDMALLTRYAMENATYQKISGTKVHTFEREHGTQQWKNKNRLLTLYPYSTGGKTGYTKRANRTLVTTASKDGVDLIAVTLNDSNDWDDHAAMYEYGFAEYEVKRLLNKGLISEVKDIEDKEFYIKEDFYYPVSDADLEEIKIEYKMLPKKKLQEKRSGKAGLAIVYFQNEPIKKLPIYMKDMNDKGDGKHWWKKIKEFIFGVIGND